MSSHDPISDMITRIRNGQSANLATVSLPGSNVLAEILDVLKREGYIKSYSDSRDGAKRQLKVDLKYHDGMPVIKKITRVSTPGKRVYSAISDLSKVHNGLGISVLSTSKGVKSDHEARQENVGGEVLFKVF